MEVWCYGQDVYDLFRVRRPARDGLRAVADFGVRTMRFSFANNALTPPEQAPYVRLTAASGAVWEWNEPTAGERVEGPAEDFCLVVTQRRHVRDTSLAVTNGAAAQWMSIAQCIAGPPRPGPAPGERVWG